MYARRTPTKADVCQQSQPNGKGCMLKSTLKQTQKPLFKAEIAMPLNNRENYQILSPATKHIIQRQSNGEVLAQKRHTQTGLLEAPSHQQHIQTVHTNSSSPFWILQGLALDTHIAANMFSVTLTNA